MHEPLHVWCRHQAELDNACNAVIRIWSNVKLPQEQDCVCRTGRIHYNLKGFAFDITTRMEGQLLQNILQDVLCRAQDDTQP